MINVTLVGTGNVSSHLERVFTEAENVCLTKVVSSRGEALKKAFSEENTAKPNIYIIAVNDDVISSVSEQLITSKDLIVHTSGSVSIDTLPKEVRRGVFYPLQTFSKDRNVDFESVPMCIEAERKEDLELLHKLATSISKSVYEISSQQRKLLHLAAVFINNFTNHLYQIGSEICDENQVPFDILEPLIKETVAKIKVVSPLNAQTGPAMRGDERTIAQQVKQIQNPTHKEVYLALTKSIKETYGKKL